MRLATPRPTGKLPGMGNIAKNPFNKMQKIKVPKPPKVKPIKTASAALALGGAAAGGLAGYHTTKSKKNRKRNALIGAGMGLIAGGALGSGGGGGGGFSAASSTKTHGNNLLRSAVEGLFDTLTDQIIKVKNLSPKMAAKIKGSKKATVDDIMSRKPKSVDEAKNILMSMIKPAKTAGYSHEYYMANRQKIKQKNKQYRMANSAKLRMARQRYQRELSSGARRKAKRIRSGTQYITYGGF